MEHTLHECAQNGNLQRCQRLIDRGFDVNTHNNDAESPLFLASLNGDPAIVKLLLEHGAVPNEHEYDNNHPLHMATSGGYEAVVKLLLEHGSGAETNPNARDYFESTAIYDAVVSDQLPCLKLLLQHGGNPNLQDDVGGTALHDAVFFNKEECIRLLLDYGAKRKRILLF